MPVKAVSVNEEVQARRPNTCQWRAAKVLEDANQAQHRVVKLKFIGDTTVHTIPWAHIKLFQYVGRDALFRRSLPSRPVTRSSHKVISIDLTDLEDQLGVQPQQNITTRVNGRCSEAKPGKGEAQRAAQLDCSSSVTSGHVAKPQPSKSKPLITDPCLTSSSDLNAPLSVSDHDIPDQTATPTDDTATPQTSTESVSIRMRSNNRKRANSSVENGLKLLNKEAPASHSIRRHTRRLSHATVAEAPKEIRNNEIIWETRPPRLQEELGKDLEKSTSLNGKGGILRRNQGASDTATVPIPRERHPHRALGDIPIPRARPQLNESLPFLEPDCELSEETFNHSKSLTPSKRPRSSNDVLYRDTKNAKLSKFPSNGLRRRMRKKPRRFLSSGGPCVEDARLSTERFLEVISKSETNVLERFKSTARFPLTSKDEELEDDVDKLINNGCDEMVDEHKNEVHAMLQSFDELKIEKKLLTVRNQGSRKKSTPKRWTDRKVTERTVFQGAEGPFLESKEDLGVVKGISSVLFNSSLQDQGSVNREMGCVCQSPKSSGGSETIGGSIIQCGLCGNWSHLECVGLDQKSVEDLRGSQSAAKKHFVCTFCVDDATYRCLSCTTARAKGKTSRRAHPTGSVVSVANNPSDLGENREWSSHISPIVPARCRTKKYNSRSLRKLPKSTITSSGNRYRPRSPLSEAEIEARNKNVEFLRSGVLKPSVGLKERELIDGKIPNFSL